MAELKLFQRDFSVYPHTVSLSQEKREENKSILEVKEQGASSSWDNISPLVSKDTQSKSEKIFLSIRHIRYALQFLTSYPQDRVVKSIESDLYDLEQDFIELLSSRNSKDYSG